MAMFDEKGDNSRSGMPELHSDMGRALIMKVCAPLVLSAGIFTALGSEGLAARIRIEIPFSLLVAFHLSLAVVRIRDGSIWYRRWLKWVPIDPADVVSSGVTWPSFIGYVRLRRFLFPWGRLYFVLDPNLQPNPFRRGDYAILNFVRHGQLPRSDAPKSNAGRQPLAWAKLGAAGLAGVAMCLLQIYLNPPSGLDRGRPHSPFLDAQYKLSDALNRPEVGAIFTVGFLVLSIRARNRSEGWIFAFFAGLGLTSLLYAYFR
jgi:hypothetical protein